MKARVVGDLDVMGNANRSESVRAEPHHVEKKSHLGHLSKSFDVAIRGEAPAGDGGVPWLAAGGRSADQGASQTCPASGVRRRHIFAEETNCGVDAT